MKTLTLEQVPRSLLERLRAEAKRQHRTVDQLALALLEEGLERTPLSFGAALALFLQKEGHHLLARRTRSSV